MIDEYPQALPGDNKSEDLKNKERQQLEKMVLDRTEALEIELADRKKAEKKLILTLDKITRNRQAILNLMEDLKAEMNERKKVAEDLGLRNSELQFLNNLATDLAGLDPKVNMSEFLMKRLKTFTESDFVVFSEYDSDQGLLITRHVETDQMLLNTLIRLVGNKILDSPAPIKITGDSFKEIMKEIVSIKKSLTDLSFGAIPVFIDKAFASITGFDWYYGISYVVEGKLYGTSMLGFKKNQAVPSSELLKSFAHMAAISLHRQKAQEKLESSEEKYRLLIESQGEGVGIVDLDEKFVFTNPAAEEMFGVSQGGLLKSSLFDFVIKEQHPLIFKESRKRISGEKSCYEIDIIRPNGERRTLLITATPRFSKEGKLTGTFGVFRDISDRKRAEEALKESEKNYRYMFENNPQPMWIYDVESLSFVQVNTAAINHYGYSKEEFLSMTLNDIRPQNVLDKLVSDTDLAKRTFNPTGEWHHLKKNSDLIHVQIASHTVSFKDRPAMHVLVNDITERKEMEEKLIESEAYYRTLVDVSPDGILLSGMDGILSYGSVKTMEIFGIESGTNLAGSSILDWVSTDYHVKILERIAEILTGNLVPETSEYKLLKQDRSVFWGELSSSALTDRDNNPTGLLIVCRDITQRKKAEQDLIRAKEKAEESDKLKTAFIHNISHEIRTPMNAITGFSSLLGEPDLSEETRNSFTKIIMEGSDQLLKIVTDIIEISNIEAGTIKIVREDININLILEKIYNEFVLRAKEKNLNLTFHACLEDCDAIIQTDKTKLQQILSNLINNALKFTHEGEINFGYSRKNEYIEFFVSDTGIGIPVNLHDRIFDRFYQVECSIARQYEGTGLGLTITKAYVELLGGEIWLNSSPSQGSIFFFRLPFVRLHKPLDQEQIMVSSGIKSGDIKKTILIAEDEENNFLLLEELLSPFNLKIIHALNGAEALEICKSDINIDLIIMDIKMPVMDGYTATKEILKILPELPVIAQTAYSFDSDRENAINAGCTDYISKPVNRDILIDIVGKYLNR